MSDPAAFIARWAAKAAEVEEILDTLVLMGRARCEEEMYALK